jgi:hypothetical protein
MAAGSQAAGSPPPGAGRDPTGQRSVGSPMTIERLDAVIVALPAE